MKKLFMVTLLLAACAKANVPPTESDKLPGYKFQIGEKVKVKETTSSLWRGCKGKIVDGAQYSTGPIYYVALTYCPKEMDHKETIHGGEEYWESDSK